jgi:hypothetical protein
MKRIIIVLLNISIATMLQAQIVKSVQVSTAGSLYSQLTTTEKSTVTNLTITGTIDTRDFVTMRDSMPSLASLDISAVIIASYSGKGGTADSDWNVNNSYKANELPKAAFYYINNWSSVNTKLTSVILPNSITAIGIDAFHSCSSLTSITIPSSVTSIGYNAFASCIGLTTLNIPAAIDLIGMYAFSGCSNIKSMYVNNLIPVAFVYNDLVFYNFSNDCVLYVPIGTVSVYKNANQWKNFNYIVEKGGFSISANTLSIAATGGSTTSAFVSCDSSWTVSSDKTWLTVSPNSTVKGSAFVTFTDSENTTTSSRTAIVTISAKGFTSQTITVTQDPVGLPTPTLSVSSNTINIAKDVASTATIMVTSNSTWVASSDQSWLLVSPNTQTSGNATLTLTTLANTGAERTATITVMTTGKIQTITVKQATGISSSIEIEEPLKKNYRIVGNTVLFDNSESNIYTLLGQCISIGVESINLPNGMYIVCTPNSRDKIVIFNQ